MANQVLLGRSLNLQLPLRGIRVVAERQHPAKMAQSRLLHQEAVRLRSSPRSAIHRVWRRIGGANVCLTCGCELPHEDHGNADYLTIEDLEKSAKIDSIDLDEAVKRLTKTVEVAKNETEHDHR